jgi:hypothetical protein
MGQQSRDQRAGGTDSDRDSRDDDDSLIYGGVFRWGVDRRERRLE